MRQPHQAGDIAEPVQLLDPLPTVADIVDEAVASEPLGHGRGMRGVAESILELDLEGGGQRVDRQIAVGIAELDQLEAGRA